jgi:glycosyltransferase involved in cell wall biosynthesis
MSEIETPDRPIHVLVLCDHVGYDGNLHGSGRVMVEMATGFDNGAVRLFPYVLQKGDQLEARCRDEGVPLQFLGYGRFDPRQISALVGLIRRHDIDVVHVWDFGASTYGRIAARLTRRPAIVHVQSQHSRHQRRGFPAYVRLAYRLLAPGTARAVALAPSIGEFAVREMGFSEEKVVVIPNPSPHTVEGEVPAERIEALRAEHGLPEGTPVIGTLTRFFEAKGIRYLIEALPAVLAAVPDARLLLVGEGPLRDDLERQARELGVDDRVVFAGFRHDVAAHLALFTVMALPSLEEGMPLAALESVAAGVPIVGTRVGGMPDVVLEGRTGLLIEPEDTQGLAEALVRVLGDLELLEDLRRGCREERQRFSFDHYRDRLTQLYQELSA